MTGERILRLPEVSERVGLSPATIYRHIRSGIFPQARKLGPKAIGWKEQAMLDWMDGCPERPQAS